MNSYTKFEENWSINAQDRARKRNADVRTDRRTLEHKFFLEGITLYPALFKWLGITKPRIFNSVVASGCTCIYAKLMIDLTINCLIGNTLLNFA